MKAAIASLSPVYNTHRMVHEYTERYYLRPVTAHGQLAAEGASQARRHGGLEGPQVRACWPDVRIESVETPAAKRFPLATASPRAPRCDWADFRPRRSPSSCTPESSTRMKISPKPSRLLCTPCSGEGDLHVFETSYGPCAESGLHGYTVRVRPVHESDAMLVPGCITWAD